MGVPRGGRIGDANGGDLGTALHAYQEMVSERDLVVRAGWVRQIYVFLGDQRLGKEAERSEEMGCDGKSYWEVVHKRHFERFLATELVEIGGRVKDATAFKEAYEM